MTNIKPKYSIGDILYYNDIFRWWIKVTISWYFVSNFQDPRYTIEEDKNEVWKDCRFIPETKLYATKEDIIKDLP
jgi:ABC-type transport system involved in multi-copper enzyme maturation permease subunit